MKKHEEARRLKINVGALILLATLAALLCPPARAQGTARREMQADSGDTSRWTTDVTEKRQTEMTPVVLRDVRAVRQKEFDRIVFDFAGRRIPGYHIEYVSRPIRNCGAGDVVRVAGNGWLRIRLSPAQAHTERGRATVKQRERRLRLGVLRELELTCDFEADVEWIAGVTSPNRYRVLELSNPARLVVDVKSK